MEKVVEGFERYVVTDGGKVFSFVVKEGGYELKPQLVTQSKKKYLQVRLFNEEYKKGRLYYVHKLVWNEFVGEIPKGFEINHIDENPHNCSLSNLQIMTKQNNILEYHRNKNGFLFREKRDEIVKDYAELKSYEDVAQKWGCSTTTIFRVLKNKKFGRVKGQYVMMDGNDIINDVYTQNDMRTSGVREELGLEPCRRGKNRGVSGVHTQSGSKI